MEHSGDGSKRRGGLLLAALGAFAVLVVIVVGGTVVFLGLTVNPLYTDPSAVPSTTAVADAGSSRAAIDQGRDLARAMVVDHNLPGLSVAVSVHDAVVWSEGFGLADSEGAPVTPRTRFRLGALSKPSRHLPRRSCTIKDASISMRRFNAICGRIPISRGRSPCGSCWVTWPAFTAFAATATMPCRTSIARA